MKVVVVVAGGTDDVGGVTAPVSGRHSGPSVSTAVLLHLHGAPQVMLGEIGNCTSWRKQSDDA